MKTFKELMKFLEKHILLIIGFVSAIVAIVMYSRRQGTNFSPMTINKVPEKSSEESWESKPRTLWSEMSPGVIQQAHKGASGSSSKPPIAANPVGMNSGPANADGIQTVTSGVPSSCNRQDIANPTQLLPRQDNDFGNMNQNGSGDLENINLLKAGYHAGIDTVGSTLRNSNLQLRSEPPNPTSKVSPWMNSTIEPDLMRVPLEIGCGSQ
jgi:hypothetical protein